MCADDAKVYQKIKNETDCSILQQDIEYFKTWMDTWLLKLNITKCKVVSYAKSSVIENKYYVTDDGESRYFERVENIKDLGVIFDRRLDFQAHIL